MRHRSPQFAHVFSGEGYSAGYYGYLWADVLTSDAAEAFAEAPGGFYDAAHGEAARRATSSRRATPSIPADAYRAFRGRDADDRRADARPRLPGAEVGNNTAAATHRRKARKRETLGQRFEEIREICARHDYELETGERSDQEGCNDEGASDGARLGSTPCVG